MLNDPSESSKNYGLHTSFTTNSKVEMAEWEKPQQLNQFGSSVGKKMSPSCPQ